MEWVLGTVAVVALLWLVLPAAERRGWVRLHGVGGGAAAGLFAMADELMAPARSQSQVVVLEQRRRRAQVGDASGPDPTRWELPGNPTGSP